MDINAGLLTLLGELKATLIEKDKQIETLVQTNNSLAGRIQELNHQVQFTEGKIKEMIQNTNESLVNPVS